MKTVHEAKADDLSLEPIIQQNLDEILRSCNNILYHRKIRKLQWKINFDRIDKELKNLDISNLKDGYN